MAEKRRNWDGAALEKPYPLWPMVLADVDAIRCAAAMFALLVTVKMLDGNIKHAVTYNAPFLSDDQCFSRRAGEGNLSRSRSKTTDGEN